MNYGLIIVWLSAFIYWTLILAETIRSRQNNKMVDKFIEEQRTEIDNLISELTGDLNKRCYRCRSYLDIHEFVVETKIDPVDHPRIISCCTSRSCVTSMRDLFKNNTNNVTVKGIEKKHEEPCLACLLCGKISFSRVDIDNNFCVKCKRGAELN